MIKDYKVIDRETAVQHVNVDLFRRFKNNEDFSRKAQSRPLPGPLAQVFPSASIQAGGKTIHRVVPSHFACLQSLESPLLKMIEEAMTSSELKSEVNFNPQQQWDVCYLFTSDPEQAYDLLETGVNNFHKVARKEVGNGWDAASINFVMIAILEQIRRHILTLVRFGSEMEAKGDVSFFRDSNPK
jgi:hypothetical protein